MLNNWSHKVRAILKEYCPGNIKKLLPSLSQSGNTRFYFGHQKLCMDNNTRYPITVSQGFLPTEALVSKDNDMPDASLCTWP